MIKFSIVKGYVPMSVCGERGVWGLAVGILLMCLYLPWK